MAEAEQSTQIALFKGREIRKTIHDNEWWFVINDIIQALTDSKDPAQYFKRMKSRDPELKSLAEKGGVQFVPPLSLEVDTAGGWVHKMTGGKLAMTDSFLDLEGEFADFEAAEFVILPVPYDATSSYLKGSAKAPQAIINASEQIELFDEVLLEEFHHRGICTAEAIECQSEEPEEMQEKIYQRAKELAGLQKFVLSLGGEHSITPPLVKAVAEKYSDLSVLQIDAHADLRDEYQGTRFSHACVMRRIWDMHIPAVAVGVRSFSKEQYEFIVSNKLKIFTPAAIAGDPGWISDVIKQLGENVYITLDVDGLDPAFAPGTGTPEPGGLSYQQVADLILEVGRGRNIAGADIVEVIPNIAGVTSEFTAARLAYKIIAAAQLKT